MHCSSLIVNLTLMLVVVNLVNTKWCKNKGRNPGKWVPIWECSARAIQWIPSWQGFDDFSIFALWMKVAWALEGLEDEPLKCSMCQVLITGAPCSIVIGDEEERWGWERNHSPGETDTPLSGCRIWVCRWMTSGMGFRGMMSLPHPGCLWCSFLSTLSVRFIKRTVLIVHLKCNKSGVIASSIRKKTCIIFKIFLYD